MLNKLRNRLKPLIKVISKPFVFLGLKPNHITLIALLVGILAGYYFYKGMPIIGGILVLFCGYLDVVDGRVARVTGQTSKFGGVFDSVSDRVVEGAFYIGIIGGGFGGLYTEPSWFLPTLALVGSFLVSYVRTRAESEGTGDLDVGLAERAERLIILVIGAFLNLIAEALTLIVILTSVTIIQRLREAADRLKSGNSAKF